MNLDNTKKYLHLKFKGKNPFEIVNEISSSGKNPLFAIKKIQEIFPQLSLTDAKEIVIISTTKHKSLYDYQESLFPDLEELDKLMDDENKNINK